MEILTKKEAVELYGSERCKQHFEKYGRFNNKNLENSLIKTLEQNFESVEVIKQGRANVYQVGKKRESLAERKRELGGRITNGAWKVPYTKNLDIIVVSHLQNSKIAVGEQTLNKWCLDFGLISEDMYELINSRYSDSLRSKHIKQLEEKGIINDGENRIINDFISIVRDLQGQLKSTLDRMAKIKIINQTKMFVGINTDGEKVTLDGTTIDKIQRIKLQLMEKYNVDQWEINNLKNAENVKSFNKEWTKELLNISDVTGKQLYLKFYYTAYVINLRARKQKIINYLEKYNKDMIEVFSNDPDSFLDENKLTYHKKRLDRVFEQAQKKEDNFLDGDQQPKHVKKTQAELREELGGKKKKFYLPRPEDYFFDEEYYKLYFERLYAMRIKELQEYYNHVFLSQ